jgi:hypothetical protein
MRSTDFSGNCAKTSQASALYSSKLFDFSRGFIKFWGTTRPYLEALTETVIDPVLRLIYCFTVKKLGVGGAKTAKAGSDFEEMTTNELFSNLSESGYKITATHKLSKGKETVHGILLVKNDDVIEIYFKTGLYKLFFEPRNIDYKKYFSSQLQPDSAIYSHKTKVLTIIEKKEMKNSGSVVEKLQTCDYKLLYYKKLTQSLNIEVDLVWQLGSYFEEQKLNLRSVYEYMISKGSRYYFHTIPIQELKI